MRFISLAVVYLLLYFSSSVEESVQSTEGFGFILCFLVILLPYKRTILPLSILKVDFWVKVVGLNCLEALGVFDVCLFGFFEQICHLLKLIFCMNPLVSVFYWTSLDWKADLSFI